MRDKIRIYMHMNIQEKKMEVDENCTEEDLKTHLAYISIYKLLDVKIPFQIFISRSFSFRRDGGNVKLCHITRTT